MVVASLLAKMAGGGACGSETGELVARTGSPVADAKLDSLFAARLSLFKTGVDSGSVSIM